MCNGQTIILSQYIVMFYVKKLMHLRLNSHDFTVIYKYKNVPEHYVFFLHYMKNQTHLKVLPVKIFLDTNWW